MESATNEQMSGEECVARNKQGVNIFNLSVCHCPHNMCMLGLFSSATRHTIVPRPATTSQWVEDGYNSVK